MNERHQIGKRYSAEVMALAGILWRLVVRALFSDFRALQRHFSISEFHPRLSAANFSSAAQMGVQILTADHSDYRR